MFWFLRFFLELWTTPGIVVLSYILERPKAVLKYSLLANFQGSTPFLQVFFRFCKILNLPLHRGDPYYRSGSHHSFSSERSRQALPIGQFSERSFNFCKYYVRFCEILNPTLYEGYPWHKSGTHHSQGGKRFCKVLHTCKFSGRYYQIFGVYSDFCEILNPPLYGGYPWRKSGPYHSEGIKRFHQVLLTCQFSERY